MKHFEVMRKWCKKIEIDIFNKWLISLDHVTYYIVLSYPQMVSCIPIGQEPQSTDPGKSCILPLPSVSRQ